MIKVYDKTPKIYSNLSRDFQLLGHIYDAIFNSVKTNIDMISYNPLSKNSDIKLLDLLAKTLNFESKHNYNAEDLYALCTAFKTIIKKKGTKSAVEDCINLLLKAQNISKNAKVLVDEDKIGIIEIWVPYELKDIILLEDMLDYILPAGYNYHLYQANSTDNTAKEEFRMLDTIKIVKQNPIKEYSRNDTLDGVSDIFQSTIINENDINNLSKEGIQDE